MLPQQKKKKNLGYAIDFAKLDYDLIKNVRYESYILSIILIFILDLPFLKYCKT